MIVVNANFVSNLPLVKLALTVLYSDSYPDELPRLSLEPLGGEVDAEEINSLLTSAQAVVSTLTRLRYLYATLIGDNCRERKTLGRR